jgi:iron complex outermembrane recepter protein
MERPRVTVNVRNLLDRDPPFYLGATGFDNWSASPLGRVITVGLGMKM